MPPNAIMISQDGWIDLVTQFATLTTKVTTMEGGVQSWMKQQQEVNESASMHLS